MKHKTIDWEERIQNLISRAFGLEMIRNLLEYRVKDEESRKELERINREINQINRRIGKLNHDTILLS